VALRGYENLSHVNGKMFSDGVWEWGVLEIFSARRNEETSGSVVVKVL
jgi:hypothetical protein